MSLINRLQENLHARKSERGGETTRLKDRSRHLGILGCQ